MGSVQKIENKSSKIVTPDKLLAENKLIQRASLKLG